MLLYINIKLSNLEQHEKSPCLQCRSGAHAYAKRVLPSVFPGFIKLRQKCRGKQPLLYQQTVQSCQNLTDEHGCLGVLYDITQVQQ